MPGRFPEPRVPHLYNSEPAEGRKVPWTDTPAELRLMTIVFSCDEFRSWPPRAGVLVGFPIAVIQYPDKTSCERMSLSGSQFQVTVHFCGEVTAAGT